MTELKISPERLDRIHTETLDRRRKEFRKYESCGSAIDGYSAGGRHVITFFSAQQTEHIRPESLLQAHQIAIAGPLQAAMEPIADAFQQLGVVAAVFSGETWLTPRGVSALSPDGEVMMPSQHPNREDGVFIVTECPLADYIRTDLWRIERRPYRKATLPDVAEFSVSTADGGDAPAELLGMGSWLRSTLPTPTPVG